MSDRRQWRWMRYAAGAGIAVATALGPVSEARVERDRARMTGGEEVGFAADLVIRHGVLDADGGQKQWAPERRFRVTRARHGAGWRVTMSARSATRPTVLGVAGSREIDNPFAIARLEYDENNAPVRMFNHRGQLTNPLNHAAASLPSSEAARQARAALALGTARSSAPPDTPAGEWAQGLVASNTDMPARRRALQARFGASIGRIRDLDRYVAVDNDVTHEVLANAAALPVEMNMARAGNLVTHVAFTHAPFEGGFVRQFARSERALPGRPERLATEIAVANLTLLKDGVQ